MDKPIIPIDVTLVKRLIATQFSEWKDLPIRPVESSGWDNRTFHLGESMSVRLPSAEVYAAQVEKEHYWLPQLAPKLSLPISTPIAIGKPGEGYLWPWSIYRWIPGQTAAVGEIHDLCEFATALARFLKDLEACDATGGPIAGPHNFYRGSALATYDAETRQAIAILKDRIDVNGVTDLWNEALSSSWQHAPVWVHGDVAASNLLVEHGQLSAVIDFGCMGIGDPACDLAIAWTFFSGKSRESFRVAMNLDEATWVRGKGWALWKALIILSGQCGASPIEIDKSQQVLKQVLLDNQRG